MGHKLKDVIVVVVVAVAVAVVEGRVGRGGSGCGDKEASAGVSSTPDVATVGKAPSGRADLAALSLLGLSAISLKLKINVVPRSGQGRSRDIVACPRSLPNYETQVCIMTASSPTILNASL